MLLINNLLFLLVSFSILSQSFSAVFFVSDYESVVKDYADSRQASPYRGLIFSYSPAKKKQLCADFFTDQLYLAGEFTEAATLSAEGPVVEEQGREDWENIDLGDVESDPRLDKYITDGLNTEGGPQFPLIVRDLGLYTELDNAEERTEIHFKCVGQNFSRRNYYSHLKLHISSAFRPGWWNASIFNDRINPNHAMMIHYINSSGEHVPLKQERLEEQYANTRQIINQLRVESPAYIHLTEKRDLLTLKKWQQRYLCASILSSPIYRYDRLEYATEWAEDEDNPAVGDKPLAFKIKKYEEALDNSTSRCILCEGFEDGDYDDSPTKLYLTGSYDNKESLYVLKEEAQGIFFSKYFIKVPILLNIRENIKQMRLIKNY